MKEAIVKRIQEIETALQQTMANHATLMGHLAEAKYILETIFKVECEANPALGKIADAVETAIPAVEAVATAVEGADMGKPQS